MFTQDDAHRIAAKLGAEIKKGRRYDIAVIRHEGKRITSFGISRGSKEHGLSGVAATFE